LGAPLVATHHDSGTADSNDSPSIAERTKGEGQYKTSFSTMLGTFLELSELSVELLN
jgi:hypothetical protein